MGSSRGVKWLRLGSCPSYLLWWMMLRLKDVIEVMVESKHNKDYATTSYVELDDVGHHCRHVWGRRYPWALCRYLFCIINISIVSILLIKFQTLNSSISFFSPPYVHVEKEKIEVKILNLEDKRKNKQRLKKIKIIFGRQKKNDSAGDRTQNLWFRRPAPYPLGHGVAFCFCWRCSLLLYLHS
jgi:hypothetical protein